MDFVSRLLRQPEYIHVLINPLPIYGLAMGLIGLITALILRSRQATIATLVIIFLSALSAWPAGEFGEQASDRVLSIADEDGRAWLKEHEHRADELIVFFYVLAAFAALAVAVPVRWPKASAPLAVVVLLFGFVVLGMGGYIAYAGGKIRHREFRTGAPPKARPEGEEH